MKNKLIISLIVLLLIIPPLLAASSPIILQSDSSAVSNIKSNEASSQIVEDKQPDNLISDSSFDIQIVNQVSNDNIQELNQEEIPPIEYRPVCGNGRLEIGEFCDDGNLINGDGCSSICTIEVAQELQCTEPAQIPCSRTQASWTRIWGDSGTQERGSSIEVDTSGNIYTVATTTSGYYRIEQLNTCGDPTWESVIYGADSLSVDSVAIDKCGNSYYTGTSAGSQQSTFVKKYDFYGRLLWTNSFDSPIGEPNDEYGIAIAVDKFGNVYAVGATNTIKTQGFDIIITKYDTGGKMLWRQVFNSDLNLDDSPAAVDVDEEGNVYVSGKITIAPTKPRFWLGKYSSKGELLWDVDWRDQEGTSFGSGIEVDNNGNIFVAVTDYTPNNSPTLIVKYSTEGELLDKFGYGDKDNLYDSKNVHVDNEGKIFLVGSYNKILIGQGPSDKDLWLGKFTSTFDFIYNDIIDGNGDGPSSDKFWDTSTDTDRNVYSVGMIGNVVGGVESQDIIIKKNKYKGI